MTITKLQYDLAYIRARNDLKKKIKILIKRSKNAVSPFMCLELWLNKLLNDSVEKENSNGN